VYTHGSKGVAVLAKLAQGPQAQGARRMSAFRSDVCENGGGPRITRTKRAWMPSFIAATELLPAAQTVKRYACSFFSFFSCPYKKRTRFSFAKGEKYVLFSLRRKAPKDSPRLPSRTLMLLLGSAYPRLPIVVCSRFARQANIRRAGSNCRWEARARRRKARAV